MILVKFVVGASSDNEQLIQNSRPTNSMNSLLTSEIISQLILIFRCNASTTVTYYIILLQCTRLSSTYTIFIPSLLILLTSLDILVFVLISDELSISIYC
jgi:hypothetical protein